MASFSVFIDEFYPRKIKNDFMEKFYKKLSLTFIELRLALLTPVMQHLEIYADTKLLALGRSTL